MLGMHPNAGLPVSYLFIDAASLQAAAQEFSDTYLEGAAVEIDWLKMRGQHRKVFVYDAIPVQIHDEPDAEYIARVAPNRALSAKIERVPGFHVRTGDARHRKKRGMEQKMVDVHLAVDALSMASRGLFNAVTLTTSDLDFRPLLNALVEMGVDVTLQYRERATNDDLIAAADSAYPITDGQLIGWIKWGKAPPSFPYSQHNFLWDEDDHAKQAAHLILEWNDAAHGLCGLYSDPDPERPDWLVTVYKWESQPTHNLEIRASDRALLCKWAERNYGLVVPAA